MSAPAGTAVQHSMVAERSKAEPARLQAQNISKHFYIDGSWLTVLDSVSLEASAGEFVSIIGPSGCGKSTLFNILAGLEEPDSGAVVIDGSVVNNRLGIMGYMPQRDLLLPWRNVLDNAIIGLQLLGVSRRQAREEARAWFPKFGLEGFERHYSATLSGGMRQRAAMLRTILSRKNILLLDEPFGALDALTRVAMQEWLLEIWGELQQTMIFITHDVEEAIFVSDRIYVLSQRPGQVRLVQDVPLGRPRNHDDLVTSVKFTDIKRAVLEQLRSGPRQNLP